MVPDWAREAVHRLNLLTAATVATTPDQGNVGGYAFAYSAANAQLLLPAGFTGRIVTEKITTGGADGWMEFKDGRLISQNAAT